MESRSYDWDCAVSYDDILFMDMLSQHIVYMLVLYVFLSLMCLQSSAKHNIILFTVLQLPRTSTSPEGCAQRMKTSVKLFSI